MTIVRCKSGMIPSHHDIPVARYESLDKVISLPLNCLFSRIPLPFHIAYIALRLEAMSYTVDRPRGRDLLYISSQTAHS